MEGTIETLPVESGGETTVTSSTHCVGSRLNRVARVVSRVYNTALKPHGITHEQYILLSSIKGSGTTRITSSVIARAHSIEKSTLSRNLKRLVARGFVTMDKPAGRAGVRLHLTDSGLEMHRKAYAAWQRADAHILQTIGTQGDQAVWSLLDRTVSLNEEG